MSSSVDIHSVHRDAARFACDGEEMTVTSGRNEHLRLFCMIEGEFTDILNCTQHIEDRENIDAEFRHGCYLKAGFQRYQIQYRVMDKNGWQNGEKMENLQAQREYPES